jgi:hypothetical protein
MRALRFWPLVDDSEEEIYENVAWDLPGYRRDEKTRPARHTVRDSSRRVHRHT